MAALLTGDTDGQIYDGAAHNANLNQIEASFDVLGPYVISGLAVTAGTGLSVDVALGVAFIGGYVNKAAGFTISGLTPSTTNHLYLLQGGTGTANTTGTAPADSVKLGTALTDGSGVTSVSQIRTSGRQAKVRTESIVHGSGAGHPRAVDLSSWHATNVDGNEVSGVLPAGAIPATTAPMTLTLDDANQNSIQNPLILRHTYSGGGGAAPIGTAIRFEAETTTNGTSQIIGRIGFDTSNDTIANLTSAFHVYIQANAIEFEKFRVESDYVLVPGAPPVTANRPLLAVSGSYAGGAGDFAGSASGTMIGTNADGSYSGNLFDFQVGGASYFKSSKTLLTLHDAYDIAVGTTTGTKIGTSTSQMLGFFNATPIVQPTTNVDIRTALLNLGLIAGGANPLNTNGGALTVSTGAFSGAVGGSGATAFSWKRFALTFPSDADYTLASGEADAVIIDVQTGVVSATRDIILPGTSGAVYWVINRNAQAVRLKTSGGTGITVASARAALICLPTGVNAFRLAADVDYTV